MPIQHSQPARHADDGRDRLATLASQRRAMARTLAVSCPDPGHFHARAQVPCSAPDERHPWGTCCLARIVFELDTRQARADDAKRRADRAWADAEIRRRHEHARALDAAAAEQRARVTAAIHAATMRTETKDA